MAAYDDRVFETGTATGTTVTLIDRKSSGLRKFSESSVGNGNPCKVTIDYKDPTSGLPIGEWAEVIATYNSGPGTLTITSWVRSSAGGGPVTWTPARIYDVYIALFADDVVAPAGTGTELQYRNGTALGAVSGSVWNDATRSLSLGGATLTSSNPILNLSQTWNSSGTTFDGLVFDAVNTASAVASRLLDLRASGVSKVRVTREGMVGIQVDPLSVPASLAVKARDSSTSPFRIFDSAGNSVFYIEPTQPYQWNIVSPPGGGTPLMLLKDSAGRYSQLATIAGGSAEFFVSNVGSSFYITSGDLRLRHNGTFVSAGYVDFSAGTFSFGRTNGASLGHTLGLYDGAGSGDTTVLIRDGAARAARLGFASGSNTMDAAVAREAAGLLAVVDGTTTLTNYRDIKVRDVVSMSGRLAKASVAFTNGAGAMTGTLTNSPVLGDPTKWIPIDDNGTTRHVPAW